MDITEKIRTLKQELSDLEVEKEFVHRRAKEVREKIRKYERVLKHAEEIEQLNEPVGEKTVL
jgi:DNA repair exonuclease SbcCD ATPase subunit